MNDSRSLGVTLIELLVGLTIFIVLTLTAIPALISVVKNHRLVTVAEGLYYHLQYARSEALKRNTSIYVSFTTGDNWCYGLNAGSACNCTIAGNCGLGTVSADSPQQTSLSATGYATSVNFEGSHGAANGSGSFTYTVYNGSNLITLTIGRLGNIQMCATGVSGYTAC